jgi:hypothetical protein
MDSSQRNDSRTSFFLPEHFRIRGTYHYFERSPRDDLAFLSESLAQSTAPICLAPFPPPRDVLSSLPFVCPLLPPLPVRQHIPFPSNFRKTFTTSAPPPKHLLPAPPRDTQRSTADTPMPPEPPPPEPDSAPPNVPPQLNTLHPAPTSRTAPEINTPEPLVKISHPAIPFMSLPNPPSQFPGSLGNRNQVYVVGHETPG